MSEGRAHDLPRTRRAPTGAHTVPPHNPTERTMTRTTAQNLQHIADRWDDLAELLDTHGPDTWPPARPGIEYLRALDHQDAADTAGYRTLAEAIAHALHHPQQLRTIRHPSGQLYYQCAHCEHVGDGHTHPVREDRDPAQLGDRPVPIRLHVADARRAITIGLVTLADDLARIDAIDRSDWYGRDPANKTAPTAARWLLARLPVATPAEAARIGSYAREAATRLDRVLGTGRASAPLPGRPCPWCGGELVAHTEAGTLVSISCSTGLVDCNAPAPFVVDERARVWSTPVQLAALQRALDTAARARAEAEQRAGRAAARRAQRAAARERAAQPEDGSVAA
ncbi:hypothetical protein [Streptomyces sp. CC208A]|uniref:hypothetical protein n=1 Tax=Streptomyces sp. CC208A TaxID=3044573 RepID=UPI0024A88596|nr:hypothetical protein [Streptomyces sp. CC208A]